MFWPEFLYCYIRLCRVSSTVGNFERGNIKKCTREIRFAIHFYAEKKRCFKDNECPRHTLLLAKPARRRFFVSNGAILVHNVVFRSRNSTRFSPEIPLSQQFVPDQILWQVHRITLARNVANPASCGKKYMLDDPRPFSAASGVPKSNFIQKKCTMLKCCQEVASFT